LKRDEDGQEDEWQDDDSRIVSVIDHDADDYGGEQDDEWLEDEEEDEDG